MSNFSPRLASFLDAQRIWQFDQAAWHNQSGLHFSSLTALTVGQPSLALDGLKLSTTNKTSDYCEGRACDNEGAPTRLKRLSSRTTLRPAPSRARLQLSQFYVSLGIL